MTRTGVVAIIVLGLLVGLVATASAQFSEPFCLLSTLAPPPAASVAYTFVAEVTGANQFVGTGTLTQFVPSTFSMPLRVSGFVDGAALIIGFSAWPRPPLFNNTLFGNLVLNRATLAGRGKVCTGANCITVTVDGSLCLWPPT